MWLKDKLWMWFSLSVKPSMAYSSMEVPCFLYKNQSEKSHDHLSEIFLMKFCGRKYFFLQSL